MTIATRAACVAGPALGGAAYLGDNLDGPLATVLRIGAGTGLAWGCAALLAGYLATTRRIAMLAAVALLAAATIAYYGIYYATGVRWHNSYLEDGTPAAPTAMLEMARAAAFWLAASLVAGVALGALGQAIRRARPTVAAGAALLAAALLAAPGLLAGLRDGLPGEGQPEALVAAAVAAAMLSLRHTLRST